MANDNSTKNNSVDGSSRKEAGIIQGEFLEKVGISLGPVREQRGRASGDPEERVRGLLTKGRLRKTSSQWGSRHPSLQFHLCNVWYKMQQSVFLIILLLFQFWNVPIPELCMWLYFQLDASFSPNIKHLNSLEFGVTASLLLCLYFPDLEGAISQDRH